MKQWNYNQKIKNLDSCLLCMGKELKMIFQVQLFETKLDYFHYDFGTFHPYLPDCDSGILIII